MVWFEKLQINRSSTPRRKWEPMAWAVNRPARQALRVQNCFVPQEESPPQIAWCASVRGLHYTIDHLETLAEPHDTLLPRNPVTPTLTR